MMKHLCSVCAAVALLAGCSGDGGSRVAPSAAVTSPAMPRAAGNRKIDLTETLVVPKSVKPDLNRKFHDERVVKPNCCALQKTVFFGDAFGGSSFTGGIYMFDYNTAAPLGQVAAPPEGFSEVQGGCSDDNGNVYFANTGMSTIDEFNHSGTY